MKGFDFMDIVENLSDKDLTIEELFKDYEGVPFESELTEFEPIENEKW